MNQDEELPLLQAKKLSQIFIVGNRTLCAVRDVNLILKRGKTLALVGESGCGKSTLGRTLLRLYEPSSGEIIYQGQDVLKFKGRALKKLRRHIQMIFQDPHASFNPRLSVYDILIEPLLIQGLYKKQRQRRAEQLLEYVGLDSSYLKRYPHELSGGQKQRLGIARALSIDPEILICDEPVSALDVSVQAQIINLLKSLQEEMKLSLLFIAHQLAVVKNISHEVAVMYLGKIVEQGPTEELFAKPLHPYTQALLAAIPIPDPEVERRRVHIVLKGELPSPFNPPAGCPFHTRCPFAMDICKNVVPVWKEETPGHATACHLY